ncbi:hypothetical protein SOVF_027180 [Spinacia oleracea]|nr:hypothetical protein SOVF_027180 [Spinacia oleracea]
MLNLLFEGFTGYRKSVILQIEGLNWRVLPAADIEHEQENSSRGWRIQGAARKRKYLILPESESCGGRQRRK